MTHARVPVGTPVGIVVWMRDGPAAGHNGSERTRRRIPAPPIAAVHGVAHELGAE